VGTEPDYTIQAVIVAKDATGPGAKQAEANIRGVETAATGAGSRIGQLFALIGGAAGLGYMAKGIVRINSSLQDTQNGLATLYSAMTGADIGRSLRAAQVDVRDLTHAAAVGVGELSDYADAFQRILGPGLAAGASRDTLKKLSAGAVAAAGAVGKPLVQGGLDVQQALTSGANQRQTPIVNMALAAIGVTDAAFNKLKPAERINTLVRAFASFGPGIALMGQSWSSQFSTLTDNVKQTIRSVTSPLFEVWTQDLRDVNAWLEKNHAKIGMIAETWGKKLVGMWDMLIARAGTYAALAAGAYAAPGLLAGARGAAGAASAAGSWAGGALLPALRDPLGMARMLGTSGATTGVGGILASIGTGITGMVTAFGPAVIVIGLVTAAALAVRGAIGEFPEKLDAIRGSFNVLGESAGHLADSLGMLTAQGSILNVAGGWLLNIVNVAVMGADALTRALASLVVVSGAYALVIGDMFTAFTKAASGDFAGAKSALFGRNRGQDMIDQLGVVWHVVSEKERSDKRSADERERFIGRHYGTKDLPGVPNNNVFTGPITVHAKFEENNDPARVMRNWQEGMTRAALQGLQAARVPRYGGAGG